MKLPAGCWSIIKSERPAPSHGPRGPWPPVTGGCNWRWQLAAVPPASGVKINPDALLGSQQTCIFENEGGGIAG